jgi:metal-responsive CopG/Arc/MetJ family transcriptional regulator
MLGGGGIVMIRTNIYLTEEQIKFLEQASKGTKRSELIRRIIDEWINKQVRGDKPNDNNQ